MGRETLEGLQPPAKVIGGDEVAAVPFELGVILVLVALDGRVSPTAITNEFGAVATCLMK